MSGAGVGAAGAGLPGIGAGTRGVAGVTVARPGGAPIWAKHDCDIHFSFVMEGTVTLEGEGQEPQILEAGDAFVIPPGLKTRLAAPSDDIELLAVSLPGAFETKLAS